MKIQDIRYIEDFGWRAEARGIGVSRGYETREELEEALSEEKELTEEQGIADLDEVPEGSNMCWD